MLVVRPEVKDDFDAVDAIVTAAFGKDGETKLVQRLRPVENVMSLVAEKDGELVGHIMLSPVTLMGANHHAIDLKLVGLAPVAVRPEDQKNGVGKALIWEGLERCRMQKYAACFVLGHPEYYPKFGFKPAHSTYGIHSTYDVPNSGFMGLELIADALKGSAGTIYYHPVFAGV